jgi:hypothetical protein
MIYTTLGAACLVVLLTVLGMPIFQKRSLFVDQQIKGATTLSTEWIEITPDEPLKIVGDDQAVGIYLAEPFIHDIHDPRSGGVKLPDGSTVAPEIQIIDIEGNRFTLKYTGARGRKFIFYMLEDKLKGRVYRSVRVRAERTIECKGIYWTGFKWKYLR